jgi:hypothetical protein
LNIKIFPANSWMINFTLSLILPFFPNWEDHQVGQLHTLPYCWCFEMENMVSFYPGQLRIFKEKMCVVRSDLKCLKWKENYHFLQFRIGERCSDSVSVR